MLKRVKAWVREIAKEERAAAVSAAEQAPQSISADEGDALELITLWRVVKEDAPTWLARGNKTGVFSKVYVWDYTGCYRERVRHGAVWSALRDCLREAHLAKAKVDLANAQKAVREARK